MEWWVGWWVRVSIRARVRVRIAVRDRVRVRVRNLMEVVLPVEAQSPPCEKANMLSWFACDVFHVPQSVRVNDDAKMNISPMLVTLETSHLERSALNDDAKENIWYIVVTLDTSHLEISPLND